MRAAFLAGVLVLAAPAAMAVPGDFVGQWRGGDSVKLVDIRRAGAEIDVHVVSLCGTRDCDWGTAIGHFPVNGTLDATFPARDATRSLTLKQNWNRSLAFTLETAYADGRAAAETSGTVRLAYTPPPPANPALAAEDCVAFDPDTLTADDTNGRWRVTQGASVLLDFGANAQGAHHAVEVIQHYHFTRQCFVHRPVAAMMYWKNGVAVPVGNTPGQDCIAFNPAAVHALFAGNGWKVVDGANALIDYGQDRAGAAAAAAVIQAYNLNRQCFIARPNAAMEYWLAL